MIILIGVFTPMSKQMKTLSIIIPCYNEETRVRETWMGMVEYLKTLPTVASQVVFVND